MSRLDFEYLNDLPVLILDVDDDFKNDRIKQEAIIDKVCFLQLHFFLLLLYEEVGGSVPTSSCWLLMVRAACVRE